MRTNEKTAAKGVTWTLERHTWTTTSTTRDANGFSRTSTNHHSQYIIFLRLRDAENQLKHVGGSSGRWRVSCRLACQAVLIWLRACGILRRF